MFRTRLVLTGLLLIALLLGVGSMSLWTAQQFRYLLARTELAHDVRAEYLRLDAQIHSLLQTQIDVAGGAAAGATRTPRASLGTEVEATLDRIRTLIAREVAHTGDREDEYEELQLLARIDRQLQPLLDGRWPRPRGDGTDSQTTPAFKTDEHPRSDVGRGIEDLLREAIAEEHRELEQADLASAKVLARLDYAIGASLVTALLVGLGALLLLLRRLNQPIATLMQGTQALSDGDLSYRMPVTGDAEFALIAERFNHMADEIERHRRHMERSRESLEHGVAERTEQLRLANEALGRVDRTRRQFFADISHELRTPLTVIRGEAQFALRGDDKSPVSYKDTLSRILGQSEQLTRLVDDLLFIARSDAGTTRLERTAVALDELLGEVCADAQTLAQDRSMRIDFRPDTDPAVLQGDAGRLRQLFLILLDNAIRYSKPDSQVSVALTSSPGAVSVQVRDSGIGIPREDLDQIFERFYRGEGAACLYADGLGLGLPVAKAIAEAHGGGIAADSEPGQGTTISVSLPTNPRLRAVA